MDDLSSSIKMGANHERTQSSSTDGKKEWNEKRFLPHIIP